MKIKASLSILAAALATAVSAQAAYIFTGTTFVESFDGLPTTASPGLFPATVGTVTTVSGTIFSGTRVAGTGGAANLAVDAGGGNSGAIYSYGAAASSERALGVLASASQIMGFGVQITNGSGAAMNQISISFTQENWRSSTSVVNILPAFFATSALAGVDETNFLTFAGFTAVTELDVTGPAIVATNGALDGNDPANQATRTFTFTNLNLAAGESLYLRWADTNDVGSDAGLAIDNLTISVDPVPEPSTALLGALGLLGILRRRR